MLNRPIDYIGIFPPMIRELELGLCCESWQSLLAVMADERQLPLLQDFPILWDNSTHGEFWADGLWRISEGTIEQAMHGLKRRGTLKDVDKACQKLRTMLSD